VGKQANIAIIRGNTSANISDVRNVEIVFRDGVGYDCSKLIASVRGWLESDSEIKILVRMITTIGKEEGKLTDRECQAASNVLKIFCLIFVSYSVSTPSISGKVLQRQDRQHSTVAKGFQFQPPLGLSLALWRRRIPTNNPITREKVSLGRALYFDKRLSVDGTVSCATCHDPANAFTDHRPVAIGVFNMAGVRNAPTILNAMFSDQLFWDGRAASLEEQATQPLMNSFEMGMRNRESIVERVEAIPEYREWFKRIFKTESITLDTIAKAIATYERTQLSGNSQFDRFSAGDSSAITEIQKRGWQLFKGKARCIECHSFSSTSPFFTDFNFHNTGVFRQDMAFEQVVKLSKEISKSGTKSTMITLPIESLQTESAKPLLAHSEGFSELGRYVVTNQTNDIGAFKTPSLRDIELTTPYMHNGSEKTLLDVVQFYNRGGNSNANLDRRIRPLHLSDREVNDLVEFMRALTSDDVLRQCQQTKPQSRTP
jgi:cytochrome c peroxidase